MLSRAAMVGSETTASVYLARLDGERTIGLALFKHVLTVLEERWEKFSCVAFSPPNSGWKRAVLARAVAAGGKRFRRTMEEER